MTSRIIQRVSALALALVALSTAACAAPYGTKRYDPLPGSNGAWVYDGKVPPSCDRNKIRPRHYVGDGHATGHEHIGHNHKWGMRGFKGVSSLPPCYVRPARSLPGKSSALDTPRPPGRAFATRDVLRGDLS